MSLCSEYVLSLSLTLTYSPFTLLLDTDLKCCSFHSNMGSSCTVYTFFCLPESYFPLFSDNVDTSN